MELVDGELKGEVFRDSRPGERWQGIELPYNP